MSALVTGLEICNQSHEPLTLLRLPTTQPYKKSRDQWSWLFSPEKPETTWSVTELPSPETFCSFHFQIDDHIFIKSPWRRREGEYETNERFFISHDELMSWQPAATMPCEAAKKWYRVSHLALHPKYFAGACLSSLLNRELSPEQHFQLALEIVHLQGKITRLLEIKPINPVWYFEVSLEPIASPI